MLAESPRIFVRLAEFNDHEGERWNWWLQLDGNEQEITKLYDRLEKAEEQFEYELDWGLYGDDQEPESVVDKLVFYAEQDGGYHPAHSKVTGKFTCPEFEDEEDLTRKLYKGGINNFFVKED